jgi:hypothetical protein
MAGTKTFRVQIIEGGAVRKTIIDYGTSKTAVKATYVLAPGQSIKITEIKPKKEEK